MRRNKYIANNTALAQRFSRVSVEEPNEIEMIRSIKRRLKDFNMKEEEERAKRNGIEVQKNLKDMFIMRGRNLAVGRSSAATALENNGLKNSKLKSNVTTE